MSEEERLRAAFAGLRARALPHITPPGVDAVRRSLRRRRTTRAALGGSFCALLVAGGLTLLPLRSAPLPAADTPTSTGDVRLASATASASLTASATGRAHPMPTLATCGSRPYPSAAGGGVGDGTTVTFSLASDPRLCAGVALRVFWASYEYLSDGSQKLFASEVFELTPGKRHQSVVRENMACRGDLYFVAGELSIVKTIVPGKHHPYPVMRPGDVRGTFEAYITQRTCHGETSSPTPTPTSTPSPSPTAEPTPT